MVRQNIMMDSLWWIKAVHIMVAVKQGKKD
jgi:hypothetical protein